MPFKIQAGSAQIAKYASSRRTVSGRSEMQQCQQAQAACLWPKPLLSTEIVDQLKAACSTCEPSKKRMRIAEACVDVGDVQVSHNAALMQ